MFYFDLANDPIIDDSEWEYGLVKEEIIDLFVQALFNSFKYRYLTRFESWIRFGYLFAIESSG